MDTLIIPRPSTSTQAQPDEKLKLLFTLDTGAMYAWIDGELWISLSRIWKYLGTLEQGLALNGNRLMLLEDADGGVFMQLDKFIEIVPQDVRIALIKQRKRLMKQVQLEIGGEK